MEQPYSYSVPHKAWREHQYETLCWSLRQENPMVIEMPTGSGKSAVAKGISSRRSTTVLTATKMLQDNYETLYSADSLKGQSNYDCRHPEAPFGTKCDLCLFDDLMHKCPHSRRCEYLSQKALVLSSTFAVTNYAYWMVSKKFRENDWRVVVLDEAHTLSSRVTDFCGCTIDRKDASDWSLPDFPKITRVSNNSLFVTVARDPVGDAVGWLVRVRAVLESHYRSLRRDARGGSRKARKRLVRCGRVGRKVRSTLDALRRCPHDWYVRSGPRALKFGRAHRPGFVAKPLTARHHAPFYFLDGHDTVMMSATIGDPTAFATELGIPEYDFRAVPHRFPPSSRPVYVLDAPRMGGGPKGETDRQRELRFDKQADVIADFIKEWPKSWSGLIHVTRIREEVALAHRLQARGLDGRIWHLTEKQENYIPTDSQLAAWENRRRRVPNSLLISCSFGEGYDGLDERIDVSAKVPFPRMGDEGSYEREWMGYSPRRYHLEAAKRLAQALGRTRRGRPQDYDDGEVRGAVAVADGSFGRVKSKLPLDVQDALVSL